MSYSIQTTLPKQKPMRLGPYVDGALRGLLIFAFLGFGFGSFVVPLFGAWSASYPEPLQWIASGSGGLLGLATGLIWGHRHQS